MQPVSVIATSYNHTGTAPIHLIDGSGLSIWNSFQTGQTARGVDEFEILVSSSEVAPFVSVGTFNLAQNSDAPGQIGTIAQFRAFSAANVRRVRFEIASAHSGNAAEYVGLSEVAFLASGPQATPAGIARHGS